MSPRAPRRYFTTTPPPNGVPESLEELKLVGRIQRHGLPTPTLQVALIPGRRFRWDVVFPEQKVAVELQGGVFANGRHTRGAGFESDCEKAALGQIAGYICLSLTPGMVESGLALTLIEQALHARGWRREAA